MDSQRVTQITYKMEKEMVYIVGKDNLKTFSLHSGRPRLVTYKLNHKMGQILCLLRF
jgi:hypothetical protein